MIYLDNAATSFPKPEGVYPALDRFARTTLANPGRAGHKMALAAEHALDDARHRLNQFFHGRSARALRLHAQRHRRPQHGVQGRARTTATTSSPPTSNTTASAGRSWRWRRRGGSP